MSEEDDYPTTILMSFTTEIEIVRIIGTTMAPAFIKIKTELFPTDGEEENISSAMSKIKYWFDQIANRSVVFSGGNSALASLLVSDAGTNFLDNNYLMTPGEPTDDLLATLFQAKMSALATNTLTFEACEIRSKNMLGIIFTVVGNPLELLPPMKEWIGDRTYFDEPWWNRNDASSMDVKPPADADLSQKPEWAFALDIKKPDKGTEADVVRHDFRPKVIDGGRKK